jgi:hypothetical protein
VAGDGRLRPAYHGRIYLRLAELGAGPAVIKLPVEWSDFYVTNAIVIALGIAQAQLAPALPLAPLIFASLMLINAVFFHILPVVRTGAGSRLASSPPSCSSFRSE